MNLEQLINENYSKLNENDLHIWKYINSNRDECSRLSIIELAEKCNVSKSTILRFAQKLSLKGYSELKFYLSLGKRNPIKEKIEKNVSYKVCENYIHTLNELKTADFTEVCEAIDNANRIYIFGSGVLQKNVAREMQRMFLSVRKNITIVEGEKEIETVTSYLTTDDVVFLISLRGEFKDLLDLAEKLRVKNVKTISMTSMKNNSLAQKCDKRMYIATSRIMKGNQIYHEASGMFFVLAELLFLQYTKYIEKKMN